MKLESIAKRTWRASASHASLLWLLVGAGSLYVLNVGLAYSLSAADYASLGILNSFVSLASALGLVGVDQLVTRHASVSNGEHFYPSRYGPLIRRAALATGAGTTTAALLYWKDPWTALGLGCTAVALCVGTHLFTTLRLTGSYVAAQLQRNLWKPLVLVLAGGVLVLDGTLNFRIVAASFGAASVVAMVIGLRFARLRARPSDELSGDTTLWIGYLNSLLLVTVLGTLDRFVLLHGSGDEELARYFFAQSLLLAPLTQLQSYIGFKEVNVFRRELAMRKINSRLGVALLIGTTCAGAMAAFVWGAAALVPLRHFGQGDWGLASALLLGGVVRIGYSVLSSAMAVAGTKAAITRANRATVVGLLGLVAYACVMEQMGVFEVAAIFAALWVIRGVCFYWELAKLCNEIRNPALGVPVN